MARADDYRQYAADLLRLAQEAKSERDKALLLEMAAKWRELAEKAQQRDGGDAQ